VGAQVEKSGPEYVVLGRSFRAKGGLLAEDYHGWVIGSEFAFFLAIRTSPDDMARMVAVGADCWVDCWRPRPRACRITASSGP
jgi:hypothetical protein